MIRSRIRTMRAWLIQSRAWEFVEWRMPGAKLRGTNRGLRMSLQSRIRLSEDLAKTLTACRAENEELHRKLYMAEVNEEGAGQIHHEWMQMLADKGYEVRDHGGSGRCYSCTLTRLIDSLPTIAPSLEEVSGDGE